MRYLLFSLLVLGCTKNNYNIGECYRAISSLDPIYKVIQHLEFGALFEIYENGFNNPPTIHGYTTYTSLDKRFERIDCIGAAALK